MAVQSADSRENPSSVVRRRGSVAVDVSADDDLSDAFFTDYATGGITVQLPAITSSTVAIHGSIDGTTFAALLDESGTAVALSATTGSRVWNVPSAKGLKAVKIAFGSGQAADLEIPISAYDAA